MGKHITYDRSARGEDFESSLGPEDFKRFVTQLRDAEKTLGRASIRPFSEDELNYRHVAKKRIVARRAVGKDEKITEDMIAFKRSDEGIYPDETQYILSRTLKTDLQENEPITWEKLL
jgi:sialic acid synthase SpsE